MDGQRAERQDERAETRGAPRRGLVAAATIGALVGSFAAAVGYTAHYASATSYLSDDPAACINCHVMNEHHL